MPRLRLGLAARAAILCALFFLEKLLLNEFVDFDRAQAAKGLGALLRSAQHSGFRFLVAFTAVTALFAHVRGGERLKIADAAFRSATVRVRWIPVHAGLVLSLIPLTYWLYRDEVPWLPLATNVILWMAIAIAAGLSALLAMAPWRLWRQAAAALGNTWLYAAITALLSAGAMQLSQRLWSYTANLTFDLVRRVLLPVIPSLNADATSRVLSTPNFGVEVSEICSGLEGVGLMLAFSGAWLLYFRREYIFPRALLLIPAGVAGVFFLNVVRIATLFLIGNSGFPDVAVYGFHSQAGWIAFIAVACSLVLLSRRSPWLNRTAVHPDAAPAMHNPTAAYLMPLLAILAAGAVSHALSSDFEFFYPLRLIAGLWMLFRYRWKLSALDWRLSWRGPAVGAAVFLMWIVAARFTLPAAHMPEKLALLPGALRGMWILSRIAGAVLIVPIAEELAYRGFLMRRLSRSDFESVAFKSVRWTALTAAAIVFGAAHGSLWLPATAAGLAYGLIVVRRGLLGEAIAAHATTNVLITVTVLAGNQWQLW